MKYEVISFDCAQTLVEVNWLPSQLALDCAKRLNLQLDEQVAGEIYTRLLQTRWPLFTQLNLARSEEICQEFWREITHDWLTLIQEDTSLTEAMLEAGDHILYGPDSKVFQVYDDVVPCLETLQAAGLRMVVLSNWDNSLHRVIRHFDLTKYFVDVIASLEEGVEKPDSEIFHIAMDRVGATADQVLHIGDNPLDDVRGAQAVGIDAWLIDRGMESSEPKYLATLADLPKHLGIA